MGRIEKINAAFKREISTIIQNEIKDHRLGLVTINQVEVTKDLNYAKVYFSVLGNDAKIEKTKAGLDSAAGYIRRALGKIMDLRHIPELVFKHDASTEYSIHISQELERIEHEREKDN